MTHYEVLGVAENATSTQIRNAYRKLVKQYHPDKNPSPEAAEFIKQINEAYDVLSDPQRRATYDRRYQVYFEPVIVQQETPEEIYRREFIRHRREQEQIKRDRRRAWEVTKDNVYQKIYAVMRMVAIPIALFAFGLFVDSFLPPKIYQEIGWHGGDGYMQTSTFLIGVPKAVSDNYDYDHPVALNISVTPIFKKLKEASLTLYYQHYSWDISSWFRTFTEFLLLISSIYIAFEKEYTRQKFKLSFYMTGLFVIALLYF